MEEKKEDNKTDEVEKEAATISEVKGSIIDEKANFKEEVFKVIEHSMEFDGITYSWTYDNGNVVMDVSSSDTNTTNVTAALGSVHSPIDIINLTVNGITSLKEGSFLYPPFSAYTKLETISLPKVTTIDSFTFNGVSSLTTLNIGMESTTTAEELANILGYLKESLKDLTIQNMTQFRGNVSSSYFEDFKKLEVVSLPKVTEIGNAAFGRMSNLKSVNAPKVTKLGSVAFNGANSLTSVNVPKVKEIGNGAFGGASSLTTIDLPEVKMVGGNAFNGASSLTSVNAPKITKIGNGVFSGASSLTNINAPKVKEIGNGAFSRASSLTTIDLPEVKTVGSNAFLNASSLTTVNIGMESITTAGELVNIFGDAKESLKDLTVQNVEEFSETTYVDISYFNDFTKIETVSLPKRNKVCLKESVA